MNKKRELLKKLHNLRNEIKPDLAWQKTNREILISQIKAQTNAEFAFSNKLLFKNLFIAAYKPIGSLILIIGILFGAWIASVGATKNSLPGDFLYGFKLTTERMQVNLTLNDEKRTTLEMAFAERRLDEIKKTVEKDGSAKNKKNIQVTLKKFQESINNVKSNLAKLEVTNKQTAIKVANLVDEKTKVYVDILKDQQALNPQLATKDAEQAISVSKATGDKALSVILEEFESGGSDLKIDDLRQKINERIDNLTQSIEAAKSNIDKIIINKKIADEAAAAKALADKKAAESAAAKALADKEAAAKEKEESAAETTTSNESTNSTTTETKTENATNNNTNIDIKDEDNTGSDTAASEDTGNDIEQAETQPEEVLPAIEEIKNKPQEAEALLSRAKDYLKSGSVSQAFDLVKQADDIMTLVEKVIKANEQYLTAPASQTESEGMQTEAKIEDNKG